MSQSFINDHWDKYYSQDKDFGLIKAEMLDKTLAYTNVITPKIALDIGCGTGQLTRELYHRGYQCDGIDLSSVAIEKAKGYTSRKSGLTYLAGDIETIDGQLLPRQLYTLITCKLVYAFIKNKPAFLVRVKSLLAQKGSFILITPLTDDEPNRPAITVDYDQTMRELRKQFVHIVTFRTTGVTYFICKDN